MFTDMCNIIKLYFYLQYMVVMIIIVVLEVIGGLLAFAFWPEVCCNVKYYWLENFLI